MLSSTATLTVTVTDANDNRPMFEHDSYSFNVIETAPNGYVIGTIQAKDLDSGRYGTNGIRYSLSGAGAELFNVDDKTGAISVAECNSISSKQSHKRQKRHTTQLPTSTKRVNLTITGETGVIDINDGTTIVDDVEVTTETHFPHSLVTDDFSYHPFYNSDIDYIVMSDSGEEITTKSSREHDLTESVDGIEKVAVNNDPTVPFKSTHQMSAPSNGPGHSPCLDYETQNVYFLSFKVKKKYKSNQI